MIATNIRIEGRVIQTENKTKSLNHIYESCVNILLLTDSVLKFKDAQPGDIIV